MSIILFRELPKRIRNKGKSESVFVRASEFGKWGRKAWYKNKKTRTRGPRRT